MVNAYKVYVKKKHWEATILVEQALMLQDYNATE
jgi:hypothetical protein